MIRNILLAGAAFFSFASPAMACDLAEKGSDQRPAVGALINEKNVAEINAAAFAQQFVGSAILKTRADKYPGCSADQLFSNMMSLNSWTATTVLKPTDTFAFPVPASLAPVPTATPLVSERKFEQREVVQPVPAAIATLPAEAAKPLPAQVDMERNVRAPVRAARAEVVRILQKPVSERSPAEVAFLSTAPARLNAIEATLQQLQNAKPVIPAAALTEEEKKAVADAMTLSTSLAALQDDVKTLKADTSVLKSQVFLIGIVLLVFLVILGASLELIRRTRRRVAALETNGVVPDMSGYATSEELAEVVETVSSIKEQTGSVDIRFGDGDVERIMNLSEGAFMNVDVVVDGEKKFELCFRRIENGFYKVDEPRTKFRNHNPDTPIKDPLKFVRRNYGKNEFDGFMNVLELKKQVG